jgi:hypothetical protein
MPDDESSIDLSQQDVLDESDRALLVEAALRTATCWLGTVLTFPVLSLCSKTWSLRRLLKL